MKFCINLRYKLKMFSNLTKLIVIHLLIANALCSPESEEYFSSVAGLEDLLKTELQLTTEMQNYIDNLSEHIELLQSEMNFIRQEHWSASKDLEGYLNNPINAYRLIKRLFTDWPTIEESVAIDTTRSNFLETFETLKRNLSFPTHDDMIGSTMALVRLQETYRLDVAQVASGILNGVKYGTSMTWQDCYAVGEYLYAMADYNHTIPWFKQTTKMILADESMREDRAILVFMETVAEYHRSMGDYESALELLDYILDQDAELESAIQSKQNILNEMNVGQPKVPRSEQITNDYHETVEFKLYEQVCRGEFENSQTSHHKSLLCHLHTNSEPYRFLQPYKMEQLSIDPYVIQVYDVITDRQMAVIKRIAKPYLERSKVYSTEGDIHRVSHYRTSKTAWIEYEKHRYIESLRTHVASITGLNCSGAEDVQIANYGMGGHYEPHFDFFTESYWFEADEGNRISTAMFYLTDVEEGGGTAFPFLRILVKPRKGSMLFWYNLHRSGDEDYRTKHAACPVLKGSKWIANVWLRERDQLLARPCDLTTNHEVSLQYENSYDIATMKTVF